MNKSDWFTDWFNTSYYHTLYKDRNDKDAQLFMRNIINFLKIPSSSHLLDLPCGKGRHSIYLNSLGYKVTGADLSVNSIQAAKKYENNTLDFKLKDMRKPFNIKYDAVFNLFTSFGYFENDMDDILVLKNIHKGLHKNGLLVLDFLNVVNVEKKLVKKEIKIIDNITFNLEREIKDGFIIKHINFKDKGVNHSYSERVKYLDLEKFKSYFIKAGLKINHIFGDYHLTKFNPVTSERLIFVVS
jgi:SAM-dependent methyltransferase